MTPTFEVRAGFAREFAHLSRYGPEVNPGETHFEWLRVGGHEILSRRE